MADAAILKKLLIKPGMKVAIVNAPTGYLEKFTPLPTGSELIEKPDKTVDFAILFAKNGSEVEQFAGRVIKVVKPDGLLWIAYPKGGAKAGTDINRDILWEKMKKYSVTGVAMVAIDDVWSAMRFRHIEKVGK